MHTPSCFINNFSPYAQWLEGLRVSLLVIKKLQLSESSYNALLCLIKITRLERDLKESSSQFTKSERTFRESANQERRRLEEERAREANNNNMKINDIEAKHSNEIAALKETHQEDLEVRFRLFYCICLCLKAFIRNI